MVGWWAVGGVLANNLEPRVGRGRHTDDGVVRRPLSETLLEEVMGWA